MFVFNFLPKPFIKGIPYFFNSSSTISCSLLRVLHDTFLVLTRLIQREVIIKLRITKHSEYHDQIMDLYNFTCFLLPVILYSTSRFLF